MIYRTSELPVEEANFITNRLKLIVTVAFKFKSDGCQDSDLDTVCFQ
jgi:hypothetical protein